MTPRYYFRLPYFRIVAMVLGSFACIQPGRAADIRVNNMAANRILFLGNSLTYHPPKPEIGWTGNWGMAASTQDKDYAHLVTAAIATFNGGNQPVMHEDNIVYYGGWEQKYGPSYDVQTQLATLLDWKPDVLVVELGDNSSASLTSDAARTAFANSFEEVLTAFKSSSQPNIFVLSTFWPTPVTDAILHQDTAEVGGVFVDISDIYANPLNQGGWGGHPSDAGMAAIADHVWNAMEIHSVPEPGEFVLLICGIMGIAIYCRWKRKQEAQVAVQHVSA
jgi:hypothetical protein